MTSRAVETNGVAQPTGGAASRLRGARSAGLLLAFAASVVLHLALLLGLHRPVRSSPVPLPLAAPLLVQLHAESPRDAAPSGAVVAPPQEAGEAVARPRAGPDAQPAPRPAAVANVQDAVTIPAQQAARLPVLPAPARLDGVRIAGFSIPLRLTITAQGRVSEVLWGNTEAPAAALEVLGQVLSQWRFDPALDADGRPVGVQWRVRLCFDDGGVLSRPMPQCWVPDMATQSEAAAPR